jgi:hypothetical protein
MNFLNPLIAQIKAEDDREACQGRLALVDESLRDFR